ncbi:MAG TPA: DNA double-strand break repair nuclease NurA [Methanobacteriaceae archaeon]|nr:DNA double-strand break repair nuclease NurA [Methanobacteriaceae archaeon]
MLDSLYEQTLRKKDSINEKIEAYFKEIEFDRSLWIKKSISDSKMDVTIAGGDGSLNKKRFLSFIFYAVDAECLVYNQNGLQSIESSEVDLIPHHRHVEDRLRNYMGTFELKTALESFKLYDIDLYLFDGSLLGNLIRPFPLENELTTDLKEVVKSNFLSTLKRELLKEEIEISSLKIRETVEEELGKQKVEAMIYLENMENLLVIRKLLEHSQQLVGISKTSTGNEYFGHDIPDMAIFEWLDKGTGYSQPKTIDLSKEVKRDFPILNDFFRNLKFTIFYGRLEPFKNILKFELPYEATEEEVINILEIIKGNSTLGYPYLLKKAHNDVVIRNKDLKNLSKIIGFLEKSGREML